MKVFNAILVVMLVLIACMPLCSAGNSPNSADRPYGGINGSASNPPDGYAIDNELSDYYHRPVATGPGNVTYFHVGGYWFTGDELTNLPHECLMYNTSPYGGYGGNGHGGDGHIHVPVSPAVYIALMMVAIVLAKRT